MHILSERVKSFFFIVGVYLYPTSCLTPFHSSSHPVSVTPGAWFQIFRSFELLFWFSSIAMPAFHPPDNFIPAL